LTHYHVRGIAIDNYKTDLPIKKGLSPSAAICVLTARAFDRVYDLKMTIRGEMELAYQGEITKSPARKPPDSSVGRKRHSLSCTNSPFDVQYQ
jgi:mevalonate kinase